MRYLIKSLLSLDFYSSILAGTVKFNWFLASVFLSLLITLQTSITILSFAIPFTTNLESKIINLIQEIYPQELEITIEKGQAKTNVTEPYYIVISPEAFDKILVKEKTKDSTTSKVRLLAIDTKGKAENFDQYQSMALLTESSLVYYSDDKINITPLRDFSDIKITRNFLIEKTQEYNKKYNISNILTALTYSSPLIILILYFISILIGFAFNTFIVLLISRLYQIPSFFGNRFKFTVAISFIPNLIWYCLEFIRPLQPYLLKMTPLLSIIFFVFAYFAILRLKSKK